MSATVTTRPESPQARLRRTLGLWDLVIYGIVLIQPTAPMPLFGVVSDVARGHVVTTLLLAMVAMLFTAISYGRMARAYPSSGSAFTFVGREIHPVAGYLTGWLMVMDYIIVPILCTIWCSKAAGNILPEIPYHVWTLVFTLLFTGLNLRGIQSSARTNRFLTLAMGVVIVWFMVLAIRYIAAEPSISGGAFVLPFYDPAAFDYQLVFTGASIAALTYIGFDGVSTLSEEVRNPRRNVMLATVLTCLITGVLGGLEVYVAQLIWPAGKPFPDIETAYVHVAGVVGGVVLFQAVNAALLVASMGSGLGGQIAAARLLYGMGRSGAIPRGFFSKLEPKRQIPQNNVLLLGALTLVGAMILNYQLAAELINFGAFIAFIGVNLSALVHYYARRKEKKLGNLLPPLLGILICIYIWTSLRSLALVTGFSWLAVGLIYGAYRTNGFRKSVIQFETSPE